MVEFKVGDIIDHKSSLYLRYIINVEDNYIYFKAIYKDNFQFLKEVYKQNKLIFKDYNKVSDEIKAELL